MEIIDKDSGDRAYFITEVKNSTNEKTLKRGIKEALEYLAFLRDEDDSIYEGDSFGGERQGLVVVQDFEDRDVQSVGEQEGPVRIVQVSDLEERLKGSLSTLICKHLVIHLIFAVRLLFMTGGILWDNSYEISEHELDGYQGLKRSDPGQYLADLACFEFADCFRETDSSDVSLNSSSSVSFDYWTGNYTSPGELKIRGSVTYDFNEDNESVSITTGVKLMHGGLDDPVKYHITSVIHEEAVEAFEELCEDRDEVSLEP